MAQHLIRELSKVGDLTETEQWPGFCSACERNWNSPHLNIMGLINQQINHHIRGIGAAPVIAYVYSCGIFVDSVGKYHIACDIVSGVWCMEDVGVSVLVWMSWFSVRSLDLDLGSSV